jgi:hypothetical protein
LYLTACGNDKLAEQLKPRRERTRIMAATTHIYLDVDGDWANVNNWSSAAVPGSGGAGLDTVIIPGTARTSLTTNLDRTGDDGGNGLLLAYMLVEDGYEGDIGSSGNELKLRCTILDYHGDGTLFYESATGVGGQTGRAIINSQRGNAYLSDDGVAPFNQVEFVQGFATLQASQPIAEVWVTPKAGVALNTNVTITNATGLISELFMKAGTLANAAQIDQFHIGGGITTHTASNVNETFMTGGTLYWDCPDTAGIMTSLYLAGGRVDTTRTGKPTAINVIFGVGPTAQLVKNDLTFSGSITYIGVPE